MGWSESLQGCKKHAALNQSPGVCSSCLRERLSQLSDDSNKRKTTTIRIGSAYYKNSDYDNYFFSPSHSSSGDGASPARRHHRHASDAMTFLFSGGRGGGGGLKKSRSIAVVPRSASHRFGDVVKKSINNMNINFNSNGKKKGGFWSKLINGATGKRKSSEVVVKYSKQTLESKV